MATWGPSGASGLMLHDALLWPLPLPTKQPQHQSPPRSQTQQQLPPNSTLTGAPILTFCAPPPAPRPPSPPSPALCGFLLAGSGRGTLDLAYSTALSRALGPLGGGRSAASARLLLPLALAALLPAPAEDRRSWLVALIWRASCLMRSFFSRWGRRGCKGILIEVVHGCGRSARRLRWQPGSAD